MLLSKILEELLWGMGTSIEIFLLTLLFSIPLGLAVAAGRMSSFKPLQWFMKAYISIMRGTPLMLQLIVVFFGPYYIFGMTLSRDFRMIAVIIAFTINYAAYFAEIFRGGIESIPNGQYEAAQVLGYNRLETFFIIVLPQVVKIVLPSKMRSSLLLRILHFHSCLLFRKCSLLQNRLQQLKRPFQHCWLQVDSITCSMHL